MACTEGARLIISRADLERRLAYLRQLTHLIKRSTPEQVRTCPSAVQHMRTSAERSRALALAVKRGDA